MTTPSDAIHILGVPNFANYESAAALIRVPRGGGEIEYVTIGEDRLTRLKHTYTFPLRGIDYCLREMGLSGLDAVDWIVTDYAREPRWINSGPAYRKLEHDYLKLKLDYPTERIAVLDHHDGHAAGCFFPSGFEEAAVLIVDGMGSALNTQSLYHGRGDRLKLLERGYGWGIGKLYSLVTGHVLPYGPEKGFGKVMGLAPYGAEQPGPVLEFNGRDRGVTSDYSAFFSRQPVSRLVASGVRRCDDRGGILEPYFARAAYDVQVECERQLIRLARYAHEQTGATSLCLSGGVALNGRTNHLILEHTPIERVWIPPGCSDTGIPIGLCLHAAFGGLPEMPRGLSVRMDHAYTGHDWTDDEVRAVLQEHGVEARATTPGEVAGLIADQKVVAWFAGGSEHGPRALGHRSILADPRGTTMKDQLNASVKFREGYRPYAPSVLEEHARDWFELRDASPFMLQVCSVVEDKRAIVPAITHVDGTARVQEVSQAHSPLYWELIEAFRERTGVPLLLNTSFNVNREPIVETPVDAMVCAFRTRIDALVFNGRLLVEVDRYRDPERVARLEERRAAADAEQFEGLCATYLTGYDVAERDAYLERENTAARHYLDGAARYELERFVLRCHRDGLRLLIAGTPGHSQVLWEYTDFERLDVVGRVDLALGPGEPGVWPPRWPTLVLGDVDPASFDVVLVSTHEYQREAEAALAAAGLADRCVALYDTAMDSLFFTLPAAGGVRLRDLGRRAEAGERVEVIDELPAAGLAAADALASRYAFVVNYHFVRPKSSGLSGVTPEALEGQLRQLVDNFPFATVSELLDPASTLPESVGLITFDDALSDVATFAKPVLDRFGLKATVFVPTLPCAEGRPTLTQLRQLLQAKLGFAAFRAAVEERLAAASFEREPLVAPGAYPYDDADVRAFKLDLNYQVPTAVLEPILTTLFEQHLGDPAAAARELYLSVEALKGLRDAGWELGGHGHTHDVLTRLTPAAQAEDLATNAAWLRETLRVPATSLAYPFGGAGTYDDVTVAAARAAGYTAGLTLGRELISPRHLRDPLRLPRFDVNDLFARDGTLQHEKLELLSTGD